MEFGLIRERRYCVLHAPRQTGKTSALLALQDLLNRSGDYRIHSESGGEIIAGGSAFNIKAESLRLGDLTADDV